jgi:hypothetical protein
MKQSKKKQLKLQARIRDWEQTIQRNSEYKKAYRKPGSNK